VLGLFEPHERLIVIDKNLAKPRVPFILLHETGHGMPHQAAMYALMQDCEHLIDPDVTDLFEREANVFASEVLFQGEQFGREAYDDPTSIDAAMHLAKRFGAGHYSTFRRYVQGSPRPCALISLDPATSGEMRVGSLRRILMAKSFARLIDLPSQVPELIELPHPPRLCHPTVEAPHDQGQYLALHRSQWRAAHSSAGNRSSLGIRSWSCSSTMVPTTLCVRYLAHEL